MKKIYFVFGLIMWCILFANKICSQTVLTPEDAIATALKNNFDIELLRIDSTSYALDNSYAKAAFLPRVNATTGLIFNNNNQLQKFSDGTKRKANGIRSNNLSTSLQLNWTLFDGYKMFATRDKLAEFVRLGELNIKNQMVETVAAVLKNYYGIVNQKQKIKAVEDQMSINEERVKLADQKLSVGLGAKPELLQAKTDLNAQKSARLKERTVVAQLKETLNQLMNVVLNSTYEVVDTIIIDDNILLGDVMNSATSANPTLLLTQKNIDISNLILKEKKADKYPVISFNSAYNYARTDNKAVVNPFTPLFSRNNGFNYGLGISIPILNGYNVKRQIQQAQLDIDYLKMSYQSQKSAIELGITNAFKDYELQKQALALEEENILLAKENVFISVERLRLGISTYLELRETQKTLEDAYNRLLSARYSTKLAEIELKRLKGDLVK